jgi:hypothetical protein
LPINWGFSEFDFYYVEVGRVAEWVHLVGLHQTMDWYDGCQKQQLKVEIVAMYEIRIDK